MAMARGMGLIGSSRISSQPQPRPGSACRPPCRAPLSLRAAAQDAAPALDQAGPGLERGPQSAADARAFRRALSKSGRYTKKLTNEPTPAQLMDLHGVGYSRAGLVARMRAADGAWSHAGVEIRLADAYGFCWGVERAVQMAYEARHRYPDAEVHITNEIIHNPSVNVRLHEMGIHFIHTSEDGKKDFSGIASGDVVILPAFGAAVEVGRGPCGFVRGRWEVYRQWGARAAQCNDT